MNTIKTPTKIAPNQATDMRDMVAKAGLLRTRDGFLKYNTTSYGNPITGLYDYTPRYPVADLLPEFAGYTAITNCVELQAMQDDLAGKYYLANDIDCTY